jgi:hypothetical protein
VEGEVEVEVEGGACSASWGSWERNVEVVMVLKKGLELEMAVDLIIVRVRVKIAIWEAIVDWGSFLQQSCLASARFI